MDLDALDQRAAEAFDGYIVRKDLARKFQGQYPVPTYVGEFLLGRYCASTDEEEIAEGLKIVQRQLADRAVRAGEEELFKARAREQGAVKIIARLTYRQRYEQSTGRDPCICPHCGHEMGVWRSWHPTYGVIHDEGEVIKQGTYASTAPRAGP